MARSRRCCTGATGCCRACCRVTDRASGLSEAEAAARLRRDGFNELAQQSRRTLPLIALDIVREPMFALLIAAGLVYVALGDLGEAAMLLGFVAITVTISIVQESRSEKVLDALRDLTSPRAVVIRDGERRRIAGREVVCGDLIVLDEGDRVPADAMLVEANDLETDESLLTGESAPVGKQTASDGKMPAVFAGTMAVRGRGIAEVTATGARSELGKIGASLAGIESAPTPLHLETRRLVRLYAALAAALSIAVLLLYGFARGGWLDGILAGITLAMAMLPEELPLILAVFMVMGAWRLSKSRVLTRRPAMIEALGAATVLCTDKTGTLTQNRMSITALEAEGAEWTSDASKLPEALHALVEYGILASERDPFDPMEKAFHALGERFLKGSGHLHGQWALAHEYGLSSGLLAMSHVWKPAERPEFVVAAKGAPEAIVDLCHLPPERCAALGRSAARMAARGMRVLGVAGASFAGEAWPGTQHDFDFRFLGLVGLADPLRPTVGPAVAECRSAGIKVAMITGDHPATARAIAAAAGIDAGEVLTGLELRQMSDAELRRRIGDVSVFARVTPDQKLRIVEALKARGEVVAMTGDGVNDAPSLKAAHIGIAMGERGTDVAREASSLVLLDDDFGSIVRAVRLGRRIFDNLSKAVAFTFAVHVPIAGLALMPLIFGLPLLFSPVHIAFLELVIDPVCSIVFEAEPEEADIMRRPPRNPKAPLFSVELLAWSFFHGGCVLVAVALFFVALLAMGLGDGEARAAAFIALVAANFGLIVVNRSFAASLAAALARPNRAFWLIFAATAALLATVLAAPPLRALFHFALPPLPAIAAALAIAILVVLALEAAKPLSRRIAASRR